MPTTTTTSQLPSCPVPPRALRVLRLLFELAQADRPANAGALAAHLGECVRTVAEDLLALECAGFARAERARLTMAGLVLASRLPPVARVPEPPALAVPLPRRAQPPRRLPLGWAAVPRARVSTGGKEAPRRT